MSEPRPPANHERLAQIQADVGVFGAAFAGLCVLLEISVFGDLTRMGLLAVASVVAVVFSGPVCTWLYSRIGHGPTDAARLLQNLLTCAAFGHLTHWTLAVWAMLIMIGGIQGVANPPGAVWQNLGLAIGTVVVSLLDGVEVVPAVSAAVAILSGFWINHRTAQAGTQTLARLDAEHRDLEAAHEQLRKMQASAVTQEKLAALGMLAAGIAHEINNPMAYVTSNVVSLSKDLKAMPSLPEDLREYVEDLLPSTLDGIRRVNEIVADLRRFSRGDPEGLSEYDINDQVNHALRITHSKLRDGCEVERRLGTLPRALGRPQQIVQVLVNLIVNAVQAMKGRGTLTITTVQHEGTARISVTDTGSGIAPDVLLRLFEPFFTTKPVGEGTGLGLSVVHGIVTGHGGRIEVESEVGKGTSFIVSLPLAPDLEMGPQAALSRSHNQEPAGAKPTDWLAPIRA